MTTLLLIRHGDNDSLKKGTLAGRTPGIHLNDKGRQQAADLAQSLAKAPIKAIYVSPLERAGETAEPLATALGLQRQVRSGLVDGDFGEWQGQKLKTLHKHPLWKQVVSAPSRVRFPGGESFMEMQTRLVTEIDAICARHEKDLVAVVFHADPIKTVLTHYLGMPLDNFQRLMIHPGSVSILSVDPKRTLLLALNLIPPFQFQFPKK
ncbi:MAG: MSMEG_4193 family putative phosphomutase [Chloroflexota bacterium]